MIRKLLSVSFSILSCLLFLTACSSGSPDAESVTSQSDPPTAETATETAPSDIPLEGKWYDVNGDTLLTITGDSLEIDYQFYKDTFQFQVVRDGSITYIKNADQNSGFLGMSDIEVRDDGSLVAYEMVLDANGHTYHFVREEALEKERQIMDYSEDLPKAITSTEIESFQLVFEKNGRKNYGLADEWPAGFYSWSVTRSEEEAWQMDFRISGDSYIIMDYSEEVDRAYAEGLAELINENNIPENNGYYMANNVSAAGYSLYVEYASGEVLTIHADGDAADTCVFDMRPLLEYAKEKDLPEFY